MKNFFEIGECKATPYEVSERCNVCANNDENRYSADCRFCDKDPDQMACGGYCGESCPVDEDIAFEGTPST